MQIAIKYFTAFQKSKFTSKNSKQKKNQASTTKSFFEIDSTLFIKFNEKNKLNLEV